MNAKLLKLARMVLKFESTIVGETEWLHEGPLAEGVEVYIADENGEMVAVADGEYEIEGKKITIVEGKVASIVEPEIPEIPEPEPAPEPEIPEPEPAPEPEITPEPEVDERDIKIAELEAKIAEMEALIEEKDSKIAELEAKIVAPVEEPIEMKATPKEKTAKTSGAMKFFND